MSHPKDHHFRCFDESRRRLPRFQIHFASRARGDDRSDPLLTGRKDNFSHQATDLHALDSPDQLVSATEVAHNHGSLGSGFTSRPKQQPVHFTLRNSVVSPGGANASDLLLVNPLLDRGEADTKFYRRLPRLQQFFGRL